MMMDDLHCYQHTCTPYFLVLCLLSFSISLFIYNSGPGLRAGKYTLLDPNAFVGLETLNASRAGLADLIGRLGRYERYNVSIALGVAVTSKGSSNKFRQEFLLLLPTFRELLPSFCKTATVGFRYHFYFSYDNDDAFFTKPSNRNLWRLTFGNVIRAKCPKELGDVQVHLVHCAHAGRPAWAQNDAIVAAYKGGHDFFYRVNDDTVMQGSNWGDIFIYELGRMRPPFLGVVGPSHTGGNTAILTYDFTHRTHIDIFGYHYPRTFPWWYADDWITKVYGKNHTKKVKTVQLKHTMSLSTRYRNRPKSRAFINKVINDSRLVVDKYIEMVSIR